MPKLSKGELARDRTWGRREQRRSKSVAEKARQAQVEQEKVEADANLTMAIALTNAAVRGWTRMRRIFLGPQ